MNVFRVATIGVMFGLAAGLAACSGTQPSAAPPPTEVQTVMPAYQTFHHEVSAYGQIAADSRHALALSLPQAGLIASTKVIAGQRVQRGDALLALQTDPTTRSAYLQAQSALNVARDDLARTQRLHAQKLATNSQLDAARKAVADAQAALDAQAKLGGAQPTATLRAPADGVVTALDAHSGQRVAAGTTLIQFSPSSALTAQLGVDPGAAGDVHTGMEVVINPVYAASGARPLQATVAMAGDAVNPQSHLVDVVATLDAQSKLPPGTAVSANLQTSSFKAWAVPRDALQSDARGSYVFQIEHGKAKRVDVKVVSPDGTPVGVEGALDSNAPVITVGSYEVSDGDAVKAQSAKGSRP